MNLIEELAKVLHSEEFEYACVYNNETDEHCKLWNCSASYCMNPPEILRLGGFGSMKNYSKDSAKVLAKLNGSLIEGSRLKLVTILYNEIVIRTDDGQEFYLDKDYLLEILSKQDYSFTQKITRKWLTVL